MTIPKIPTDLVEYLESTYPDAVPDFGKPNEEKCFIAGQVHVVRLLRHHLDKQSKTILDIRHV